MHSPDCPSCSGLDRAQAYRYIGEKHIIPISHGSAWLARDLYETLHPFEPGDQAAFDYAGRAPDAPSIVVTMGQDRMLTATVHLADGAVTELRRPAVVEEDYSPMVTAILQELVKARNARGVIIITRED